MLFVQGPSSTTRTVFLAIASVVLMNLDHREGHLESIRSALNLMVSPLQYVVDIPAAVGDWAVTSLRARETLLDENRTLKRQQLEQQARLQQLEAIESENIRLRELLQSSRRLGQRVLIGELLAVDLDPFKHLLVINKGTQEGVFDGQPLLDAHGVMGQVVDVAPYTSTAMLLTDPSHGIPVQVNRNGLRAVALGTGAADILEIPHLPNNADIQVGDLLVTSGLGQRFPTGYPVAVVSSIEKDPTQPYARITATPRARLDRSREVLLVWNASEGESR